MYDYFVPTTDLPWWDNPTRPSPPLYKRQRGWYKTAPRADTPTGPIFPASMGMLTKLTDEQVRVWNAT